MIVCGFEKFNPFYKKGWPHGFGFRGSCGICPRRNDCNEGKNCKIFGPSSEPKRPEVKIVREDIPRWLKITYWLSTLLWAGTLIGICVYHIFKCVCK